MRRKQKRRRVGYGAAKLCDQITRVAPDLFAGVINEDRGTELLHLALEAHGNVMLAARQAIDFDQLDKQVFQSIVINQNCDPALPVPQFFHRYPRDFCAWDNLPQVHG
jgi:hypothetical protein